jgi:hypothetical protein
MTVKLNSVTRHYLGQQGHSIQCLPWKSTGDEVEHHLLALGSSTEDFQVCGLAVWMQTRASAEEHQAARTRQACGPVFSLNARQTWPSRHCTGDIALARQQGYL